MPNPTRQRRPNPRLNTLIVTGRSRMVASGPILFANRSRHAIRIIRVERHLLRRHLVGLGPIAYTDNGTCLQQRNRSWRRCACR
ncbi:unnamed protein product [Tuwongella immobilis]|uniref:Uncharacterized protein n=1 Tax=Tuwongella immobilis TaxID=692036 RepID=A0A6C2YSS2_9BACT|nr:unnamed protein product [Tuwongella immobilis]VTS06116.1 unnamed protein product [Tuwongella immobilis]